MSIDVPPQPPPSSLHPSPLVLRLGWRGKRGRRGEERKGGKKKIGKQNGSWMKRGYKIKKEKRRGEEEREERGKGGKGENGMQKTGDGKEEGKEIIK